MSASDVDRLDEAAATLRGLISEAHAATKDLRKATSDARSVLKAEVEAEVSTRLREEIRVQWSVFCEEVHKAVEISTEAVYKRFDDIVAILQGRGQESSIAELLAPLVFQKEKIDFDVLREREKRIRLRISRGEGKQWAEAREAVGREPYEPVSSDGTPYDPSEG